MKLGWVVDGERHSVWKWKSRNETNQMASTDRRVSGESHQETGVYALPWCHAFTGCFVSICYVPGSVLGSEDSRINQTWLLPWGSIPCREEGHLSRHLEPSSGILKMQNPCLPGFRAGLATLVLGLGDSIEVCQMEEIRTSHALWEGLAWSNEGGVTLERHMLARLC